MIANSATALVWDHRELEVLDRAAAMADVIATLEAAVERDGLVVTGSTFWTIAAQGLPIDVAISVTEEADRANPGSDGSLTLTSDARLFNG